MDEERTDEQGCSVVNLGGRKEGRGGCRVYLCGGCINDRLPCGSICGHRSSFDFDDGDDRAKSDNQWQGRNGIGW